MSTSPLYKTVAQFAAPTKIYCFLSPHLSQCRALEDLEASARITIISSSRAVDSVDLEQIPIQLEVGHFPFHPEHPRRSPPLDQYQNQREPITYSNLLCTLQALALHPTLVVSEAQTRTQLVEDSLEAAVLQEAPLETLEVRRTHMNALDLSPFQSIYLNISQFPSNSLTTHRPSHSGHGSRSIPSIQAEASLWR